MQDFTPQEIQDQFDKLPPALQEAISSPEINEEIIGIGKRYGLPIDQIGELVDQVGLVMLGLARSTSFVRDTARRLSLREKDARAIAEDINKEVFSVMKTRMREATEAPVAKTSPYREPIPEAVSSKPIFSHTDLEKAGGFTIENESTRREETPEKVIQSAHFGSNVNPASIKNPSEVATKKPEIITQKPVEQASVSSGSANNGQPQTRVEALADHLLKILQASPISQGIQKNATREEVPANLPVEEESGHEESEEEKIEVTQEHQGEEASKPPLAFSLPKKPVQTANESATPIKKVWDIYREPLE
ncbi:MAG: hypothetical protein WCT02_01190 [Candidatus Paceibacterota bacterium]